MLILSRCCIGLKGWEQRTTITGPTASLVTAAMEDDDDDAYLERSQPQKRRRELHRGREIEVNDDDSRTAFLYRDNEGIRFENGLNLPEKCRGEKRRAVSVSVTSCK